MHPAFKILLTVLVVVGYLVASYYWEAMVFDIVVWWWSEIFATRFTVDVTQAIINFTAVLLLTFCAVPYFIAAPLLLASELLYLVKEQLRKQPYYSRYA